MIEVQINDEITDYEEKITPIMTMKQCIISGITVLLVTPIFLKLFFTKEIFINLFDFDFSFNLYT